MATNVGRYDRWIRVILGALLLVVAAAAAGLARWVALVVGVVLVVTAAVGYCPLYGVCHISTVARGKKA